MEQPLFDRPSMYTALGLTSLDGRPGHLLRGARHVRRMDWSRLPRKFITSWFHALRCRGRAHSYGHHLTRELQLIGFNTDRAAVQLGVSLSWGAAAQDKEMAQAHSTLAARCPVAPVETKPISEQARTERTQSEHWALPGNLVSTQNSAGQGCRVTRYNADFDVT
jgi:hypothetical protein